MSEEKVEFESVVEGVLGGSETHSPEAEAKPEEKAEEQKAPESPVEAPAAEFGGDIEPFADSAEKKEEPPKVEEKPVEGKPAEPDAETLRLREEVRTLDQRLRDTQRAMHQATEQRSKLQKELEDLKSRKDEDASADWFDDDEDEKPADKTGKEAEIDKVETRLKETDKSVADLESQQKDVEAQAAVAIWDAAAAEVRKSHPDFDKVVYDEFAPMLDEKGGNALVRGLWAEQKDKSPAAAYAFATRIKERLEAFENPDAYREKLRLELEKERGGGGMPTGKAGLDMVNSAVGSTGVRSTDTGSVIDSIL